MRGMGELMDVPKHHRRILQLRHVGKSSVSITPFMNCFVSIEHKESTLLYVCDLGILYPPTCLPLSPPLSHARCDITTSTTGIQSAITDSIPCCGTGSWVVSSRTLKTKARKAKLQDEQLVGGQQQPWRRRKRADCCHPVFVH